MSLQVKAVTKIREYFLLKINQFKKPLANYQIPQNAMLRSIFSRIKVFVLIKNPLSLNASLQVQGLLSFSTKREQRGCQGGEEDHKHAQIYL